MAALTPKALDHRRRVLEHQEKICTERSPAAPANPQLKIPLIAPANPGSGRPQHKRKKVRTRPDQQPKLGDL